MAEAAQANGSETCADVNVDLCLSCESWTNGSMSNQAIYTHLLPPATLFFFCLLCASRRYLVQGRCLVLKNAE